jgi:HK97 family phage prohead protease
VTHYTKRFTAAGRAQLSKRSEGEAQSGGGVVRGYAAVFYDASKPDDTQYRLWDDIIERVMPGAFDRALKESHDARALWNHDHNWLLGRVSSGTVRLSVDAVGLRYEVDVNDADPQWLSVAAKIDRGDVTGSSFGFITRKATWIEEAREDGSTLYYRQIEDVDLFDVSPVTWPAYTGTSAGRSISEDDRRKLLLEARLYQARLDVIRVKSRLAALGL